MAVAAAEVVVVSDRDGRRRCLLLGVLVDGVTVVEVGASLR